MSVERIHPDEKSRTEGRQLPSVDTAAKRFSAVNVVVGLLGFVGPVIWGNDDDGLINTEPGLFLGEFAINGPHALVHVIYGLLGLAFVRDTASARRFMGSSALFWGAMAAMGWRAFGLERGVHMVMGLAIDGWANVGHALFSVFGLTYTIWPQTEEDT